MAHAFRVLPLGLFGMALHGGRSECFPSAGSVLGTACVREAAQQSGHGQGWMYFVAVCA